MTNAHALRDRMLAAIAAGLASAVACGSAACGKEDVTPLGPSTAMTAATANVERSFTPAAGSARLKASDVNHGRACMSVAAAERMRRADWGSDPVTGCPRAVDGTKRDTADWPTGLRPGSENDAYVDSMSTQTARADAGAATVCCFGAYRENDVIVGRAFVTDQGRLANVDVVHAGTMLASEIGEGWLRDATFEHASVASFERAAIELEACGAPRALVGATRAAALDEARHAALAFGLASRHLGARVVGGAVEACAPRAGGTADLAARVLEEGCIGESIAALAAERAWAAARDPEARAALRIIADDEARHAALAWETVAWAVAAGGAEVVTALRSALARIDRSARTVAATDGGTVDGRLADHGRLTRAEEASATAAAWRDVITPCCEAVIGAS